MAMLSARNLWRLLERVAIVSGNDGREGVASEGGVGESDLGGSGEGCGDEGGKGEGGRKAVLILETR